MSVVFLFTSNGISASDKNFGIGVMLDEPTELRGNYRLSADRAVNAALAYSFLYDNNFFAFHTDYFCHRNGIIDRHYNIPLYYGFGAQFRMRGNRDNSFGRGVLGLIVYFREVLVDIFFEAATVINLLPDTNIDFDIAAGTRYFFDNQRT